MLRRALASTLAATAALALAACGGGSDSSGGSGGSEVLRVATEGTYAPFTYHDPANGNQLTGFDVDVARAVGKQLGMRVEFTDVQWDSIFAGLQAGRYDVVANEVTATDERKGLYDLTTPYSVTTGAIIDRADDTSITGLSSLAGKTTAQSSTSNWAQVARDAGADVQAVEGFTQAVALLKQGRVDATVNDRLAALDYLQTSGDTSVKIAAVTDDTTEQAMALQKGSDLTPRIDQALQQLRADGTLARISQQYFGEDVTQ